MAIRPIVYGALGRRKQHKKSLGIPERSDVEKEQMFSHVKKLADHALEEKAARQAEAESWIAKVKARRKAP